MLDDSFGKEIVEAHNRSDPIKTYNDWLLYRDTRD